MEVIYERGIFSVENGIQKGKGSAFWEEPPRIFFFWYPTPLPDYWVYTFDFYIDA